MENHNIDKTFNEASKALDEPETFPGFDKVWNKIEEKLDKKEEKKKTILMWFPYGIAASLMIGVGIFYFLNKKHTVAEPATTVIAENPKAKTNTNIAKIDSTVKFNIEKEIATPKSYVKTEKLVFNYNKNTEKVITPDIFYPNVIEYKEEITIPSKKDTLGNKEIEQVIVMGLKREKSSMNSSTSLISSNDISNFNKKIAADTAVSQSFGNQFDIQNELKEPLILGYNKSYKKKVTAPTSATAEKIGDNYLANQLQGKVAGLNISSSGSPGSGKIDILVRGQSSLNAVNNPLYIINGTITDVEEFKKMDPKKIESLTVLKGEKALALYGNQAVNGVIVIETKDISKKDKQKVKEILEKSKSLDK